ncbi:MAG: T9SS type A sorting domain-containing protein [Flavobacteriaceae bacterium]|nr:T9SS type A sorting domain-containing protein [Flavobacteriaceae bacterium]
MKKKHVLKAIFLCLMAIKISSVCGQSRGNLAFTAYNADGDDDFAVVALADISSNTTIYFTDYEWDENSSSFSESGTDGFLIWNTGTTMIKSGTIVVFTDIDNSINTNYGVSIGTISSPENIALLASGETIFSYTGTDKNTPITFLSGIKNGAITTDLIGTGLGGADLEVGIDFLEFNPTLSPDGGIFSGSRANQLVYTNYLTILVDKNNWTRNTSNGEALLPFSQEAFTTHSTTWNGNTNTVWNLATNWDNGIPSSASLITIPNTVKKPVISTENTAYAGNLIIETNGELGIDSNNSLSIKGILTNNGTFIVNSSGSLIINGTATGTISYKRTLTTNWHLISCPVSLQDINTFTITDLALNAIATSGSNYGIAPYNNNGLAWSYFTTETIVTGGNFIQGKGYSALRTTIGDVTFTGQLLTSNITIDITEGTSNKWNLIGNPFPSYIPANSNADAVNNFLTLNTTSLDPSYHAIYFWDGDNYTVVNQASEARFIAPGQGFFVNSIVGGSTVLFTEAMQSHQTTDVFSKTQNLSAKITVRLTDGSRTKKTEIKYLPESTTGLDPGYDAGMFSATNNSFSIYTQLIEDGQNVDFILQSLPDNDYENLIIPIGINAEANTQITISINSENLPNDMMVFIEDLEKMSIKRLDSKNSNYVITLDKESNGIGRFYLRTSITDLSKTLDIITLEVNQVQMFSTKNRMIRIIGLKNNASKFKMFSLIGKGVLNIQLNPSEVIDIGIPTTVQQGVYIISVEFENGKLVRKIILK